MEIALNNLNCTWREFGTDRLYDRIKLKENGVIISDRIMESFADMADKFFGYKMFVGDIDIASFKISSFRATNVGHAKKIYFAYSINNIKFIKPEFKGYKIQLTSKLNHPIIDDTFFECDDIRLTYGLIVSDKYGNRHYIGNEDVDDNIRHKIESVFKEHVLYATIETGIRYDKFYARYAYNFSETITREEYNERVKRHIF